MTDAPHLPGFGRCGIPRLSTGHSLLQQALMLLVICTLHTQEPRFVESHICQNRADVGHPSSVTDQAVRNAGLMRNAPQVVYKTIVGLRPAFSHARPAPNLGTRPWAFVLCRLRRQLRPILSEQVFDAHR